MDRRALLLGAAGVGAAALGGAALLRPDRQAVPLLPVGAANAQTAEASETGYDVIEMVLGDPDAPVELIEYSSFTCPHCRNLHATVVPQLMTDYVETNRIRYVYREVYFDRFGLWASMVARCGGPDRFFGIVDLIYEQQPEWTQGAPGDDRGEPAPHRTDRGSDQRGARRLPDQPADGRGASGAYEANTAVHDISGTPTLGHQRRDAQQHELCRSFGPSGRSARRGGMTTPLGVSAFLNWRASWPAPGPVRRLRIWARRSSRSRPRRRRHPPLGTALRGARGRYLRGLFPQLQSGQKVGHRRFPDRGRPRAGAGLARDADVLIENFKLGRAGEIRARLRQPQARSTRADLLLHHRVRADGALCAPRGL
jgi:protein-disulfide isomerase